MVGTHVDITDFIHAKAHLKYNESLFRTAIESVPCDLFALNKDQCYTIQNTISKETWGDIIGKCPEDVAEDAASLALWKENNERVLKGETIAGKVSMLVKGKEMSYYNIISPIWNNDAVIGIVGININISDQQDFESVINDFERAQFEY